MFALERSFLPNTAKVTAAAQNSAFSYTADFLMMISILIFLPRRLLRQTIPEDKRPEN
jgi:hypothetical protein